MASPVLQIVPSTQLGSSAALLYTSPIGTWTQITALNALNTDTAAHTVTFYLVPSGGTAIASTRSTQAQSILPASNYNGQNEYGMVLNPGDALWGNADAAAHVTVQVSGVQNTSS